MNERDISGYAEAVEGETISEPKLGGGDGVFLTPRVIDRAAFEQMSQALRGLIQGASEQGTTLRQTVGDVQGLTGAMRQALVELQQRLERAAKVTPTLEEWLRQAEEMTANPIDPKRVASQLRDVLDKVVESKRSEFEHAVAPAVELLRQLLRDSEKVARPEHAPSAMAKTQAALQEELRETLMLSDMAEKMGRLRLAELREVEARLAILTKETKRLQDELTIAEERSGLVHTKRRRSA